MYEAAEQLVFNGFESDTVTDIRETRADTHPIHRRDSLSSSIFEDFLTNIEDRFPEKYNNNIIDVSSYDREIKSYFDYSPTVTGKELHIQRSKISAKKRGELLDLNKINAKQKNSLTYCGTLCWCCQHPIDLKCHWFHGLKPVPGWVAEGEYMENVGQSYMVYDCPLYTPTEQKRMPLSSLDPNIKKVPRSKYHLKDLEGYDLSKLYFKKR